MLYGDEGKEDGNMTEQNRTPRVRRIIGDILLVLVVLLIADVAFVMPARINAVVLKADYQKVDRHLICQQ